MAQNAQHNLTQSEDDLPQSAEITHVVVLVLDGTNTLSFAAAVDPLRAANRQAGRALYDWTFATPTEADVTLTSGLRLPGAPVARVADCDLLLVVAGFDLEAQATALLRASLRRLAKPEVTVAGIDGGPWIMAHAGILDEHEATTHWEDLERFASRFPEVKARNARYVISGQRMTSGGAVPGIDMMLHLIAQQHGSGLADRIAGSFIYDTPAVSERPQSRSALRLPHSPMTARAHRIMTARLEDPVPVADIAKTLGVSPRALQAQFRTALGRSPQAHYLGLRLDEALRLVTQTDNPLQEIALATGFSSQSSFARAFSARFGISARQRRAQDQ